MEKEIIYFEETMLPIKLYHLNMCQGATYRGVHSHTAVEVVRVESGELSCYVNNELIQLQSKEIIFINSNTGHKLWSKDAEISYMHIGVNFFMENANDNEFSKLYEFVSRTKSKPYLKFCDDNEVEEILNKIIEKYYEKQISSKWYVKAYIYELIAFMFAKSFITAPTISAKQIEKIEVIVRFINENFKTPITLNEICNEVSYNKYALCHYFKSVTGATIFEYINFLRVDFAVEKLKQKGVSILEIAIDSGFSSPTYFNRVFKNIIGCSPSVYRKFFAEKS